MNRLWGFFVKDTIGLDSLEEFENYHKDDSTVGIYFPESPNSTLLQYTLRRGRSGQSRAPRKTVEMMIRLFRGHVKYFKVGGTPRLTPLEVSKLILLELLQ